MTLSMAEPDPALLPLRGNSPLGLLRDALAAAAGQSRALDWQAPAPNDLAPLLPDYEVLRLTGRGGMGAVYECRQRSLDRRVALKLLPLEVTGDDAFAERFRAEARALAQLQHPNIVTLYEAGQSSAGHLWFTMEFVEGDDLATVLARGRLPQAQALNIIEAVASALVFAHEHGIIHRDLKPANILLGADGRPRVADFGLARFGVRASAGEASEDFNGFGFTNVPPAQAGAARLFTAVTPAYAPPEGQANRAAASPRADLYSLAVLACELLTGRTPPSPPSRPSQLAPGVNARFDAPILRALRPHPDDRPASVAEFLAELRLARDAVEHEVQHLARRGRVRRLTGLLAVLAAVAIAGMVRAHRQSNRARLSESAAHHAAAQVARLGAAADYDRANSLLAGYARQTALPAAHLARALRIDPSHRLAGPRLASLLIARAKLPPRTIAVPTGATVHWADFTPDGESVALACGDGRVRFHNTVSGVLEKELVVGDDAVCLLQFSRDGKRLFTAGRDPGLTTLDGDPGAGSGLVWDLTREPPAPLGPPIRFNEKWALLAALAPDGSRVVACGAENVARLYDVATGQALPVTFTHDARVWRVDFSPDGAHVLTSSQDRTARRWDAATGVELTRYPHPASVFQAYFSRDGRRILTGAADKTLRVWDTATRQLASPPVCPGVMLHQCRFAGDSDGDRFVMVTGTQLLRVWDTAGGQPLSEPIRTPALIHVAKLGPDGQTLLAVPWADRMYLYDTGPAPGPAPAWFAEFAEATVGARLDAAGQLTSISNSCAIPKGAEDADLYARLARKLTAPGAAP